MKTADGRTLLNSAELSAWRNEIAAAVREAEYDWAKWRAMLAWIDAEIRKLEEAG